MSHSLPKPLLILLLALLLLALATPLALAAGQPPDVRVLLASSSGSSYSITVYQGSYNLVPANDSSHILATVTQGETITFNGPRDANGYSYGSSIIVAEPASSDALFRYGSNTYRGAAQTMNNGSYYYLINRLDIESYLYGVVGRELGYSYSENATMAQAVASRSYAIGNISSSNTYYDVSTTTSSQVYGGYGAETASIRSAVDGTRGWVLTYNNKVIPAYFSSSAGGYTEDIEKVWANSDPPLKGVSSEYDKYSVNYGSYGSSCWSWTVEYTPAQLVARANSYGNTDIGSYKNITVSTTYNGQTSVSGRAMSVTINGTKGSVTATKDNIRSLLNLKSTLITVTDATSDPVAGYVLGAGGKLQAWNSLADLYATSGSGVMKANGDNSSFYAVTADGVEEIPKTAVLSDTIIIKGYGYGHGVGMSQWGAIVMGDRSWKWQDIIEHYYCNNGIKLVQNY